MKLTDDALVAVCLCTRLGRGPHVVPLHVREWTDLILELQREHQTTPSSLIDNPRTERIEDLLRGLASVGLELERLRSNGVWVLTRGDEDYPRLWKRALGADAPPVLFGAGPRAALTAKLVAIIGARKPDEIESEFVRALGELCARDGWGAVADGTPGVARLAVESTLSAGGFAVEIVADSLEHALAKKHTREAILAGSLTVLTPHLPDAPFSGTRGAECARLVEALALHSFSKIARPLRLPPGDSIESAFADRGQAEFEL